jgi:translation elongation factor EF-Tu-like GTPase
MTRHYCVWSASGNREYLRNMLNRAGFMGKNLLVREARESRAFRGRES